MAKKRPTRKRPTTKQSPKKENAVDSTCTVSECQEKVLDDSQFCEKHSPRQVFTEQLSSPSDTVRDAVIYKLTSDAEQQFWEKIKRPVIIGVTVATATVSLCGGLVGFSVRNILVDGVEAQIKDLSDRLDHDKGQQEELRKKIEAQAIEWQEVDEKRREVAKLDLNDFEEKVKKFNSLKFNDDVETVLEALKTSQLFNQEMKIYKSYNNYDFKENRVTDTAEKEGVLFVTIDVDMNEPQFLGLVEATTSDGDAKEFRATASLDNRSGANISAASIAIPVRKDQKWSVNIDWSIIPAKAESVTGRVFFVELAKSPLGQADESGETADAK